MDRILSNRRGELHVRPLESREPASGEVRLKLECAAVLPGETFPILRDRVPGRFFCARVDECGPDCVNLLEEDRVTVCPVPVADVRMGVDADGCWQDEMTVPEAWAVRLPDSVPDSACALFAPLAGIAELLLTVPAPYGKAVGIAGGDVLGILALRLASAMGFSPVCVLDDSEAYRRRAVAFGADFTLNPLNDHALGRLRNLTNGGFPVILDLGEGKDRSPLSVEGVRDGGRALFFDLGSSGFSLAPDIISSAVKRGVRIECLNLASRKLSAEALACASWFLERHAPDLERLTDRQIALSALPGAWEDSRMGLVRGMILARPENE